MSRKLRIVFVGREEHDATAGRDIGILREKSQKSGFCSTEGDVSATRSSFSRRSSDAQAVAGKPGG